MLHALLLVCCLTTSYASCVGRGMNVMTLYGAHSWPSASCSADKIQSIGLRFTSLDGSTFKVYTLTPENNVRYATGEFKYVTSLSSPNPTSCFEAASTPVYSEDVQVIIECQNLILPCLVDWDVYFSCTPNPACGLGNCQGKRCCPPGDWTLRDNISCECFNYRDGVSKIPCLSCPSN